MSEVCRAIRAGSVCTLYEFQSGTVHRDRLTATACGPGSEVAYFSGGGDGCRIEGRTTAIQDGATLGGRVRHRGRCGRGHPQLGDPRTIRRRILRGPAGSRRQRPLAGQLQNRAPCDHAMSQGATPTGTAPSPQEHAGSPNRSGSVVDRRCGGNRPDHPLARMGGPLPLCCALARRSASSVTSGIPSRLASGRHHKPGGTTNTGPGAGGRGRSSCRRFGSARPGPGVPGRGNPRPAVTASAGYCEALRASWAAPSGVTPGAPSPPSAAGPGVCPQPTSAIEN
jgi:hypothetical protein